MNAPLHNTRQNQINKNMSYDAVDIDVYSNSWQPDEPAYTSTMYDAIMDDSFQQAMLALYEDYDELIPDEYDSMTELGKIEKWVPLRKRLELFHRHFPCGELIITTQQMGVSSTDQYVSVATMYVLTEEGYEPWFSAFGMGDPATAGADGAIAEADRIAKKRVLISFGLSDDPSQEVESLNAESMRNFVATEVSTLGEAGVEPLVTAFNNSYANSHNLPKIESAQWKNARGPFVVKDLAPEVIRLLAMFLSDKKQGEK